MTPKLTLCIIVASMIYFAFSPKTYAGKLGDQCRRGNISSCEILCMKGNKKACAKASGNRKPAGKQSKKSSPAQSPGGRTAGVRSNGRRSFAVGCRMVCSPYGSPTRCDGSIRNKNHPRHGGIDMAMPEGSPIVAIANGVVVKNQHLGRLAGYTLLLRHPPKSTGSKFFAFSKYKHLKGKSKLPVGAKVRKGQRIASSGRTGTTGGYYGTRGFPHLHFSIYLSSTARNSGRSSDPVSFLNKTGNRTAWPCK